MSFSFPELLGPAPTTASPSSCARRHLSPTALKTAAQLPTILKPADPTHPKQSIHANRCPANAKFNGGVETIQNALGQAVKASRNFSPRELVLRGWGEHSPSRTKHTIQVDTASHIVPEKPFVWLNHSCEPNCGLLIRPEHCTLELYALRPIKAGEEITVDYATFERQIDFMPKVCLCGSKKCRISVTGYKDLSEKLRKFYGPYIAPYLRTIQSRL